MPHTQNRLVPTLKIATTNSHESVLLVQSVLLLIQTYPRPGLCPSPPLPVAPSRLRVTVDSMDFEADGFTGASIGRAPWVPNRGGRVVLGLPGVGSSWA